MNILITGITGFFGRNFVNYLLKKNIECTIIGTAHSECKLAYFKKTYPAITTYILDLSCTNLISDIDSIIKIHNINYIIHAAAMKHVDICQENQILALKVNAIASDTIVKVSKNNNIKNLIALSTDKSNNPCNVYGYSKNIMQINIIENGYSVYQGANFFWSDGSVLDIWFNQYVKNKPLTIRNYEHIRYFNTIDHVCEKIFENIDNRGIIILPDHVYKIKLGDLFNAFKTYFNYKSSENIKHNEYEKDIEILDNRVKKIVNLDENQLIPYIDQLYKNMV